MLDIFFHIELAAEIFCFFDALFGALSNGITCIVFF